MDPAVDRPDERLLRAMDEARRAWDAAIDPLSGARAAARCFRDIETPEAALWRGSFLAQGYMAASVETSLLTGEVRELRGEGVDELRSAVRAGDASIAARARYLLGKVDYIDRFGAGLTVHMQAGSLP